MPPSRKDLDDYQQGRLRHDAQWEFLFSTHKQDERRREAFFKQIIVLLEQNCNRLAFGSLRDKYQRAFGRNLDAKFLNELFCTCSIRRGSESLAFQFGAPFFRLVKYQGIGPYSALNCELDIIHYIFDPHEMGDPKNIFVSSQPVIRSDMTRNVKLADKFFEILPDQRKMPVFHLMNELQKTKEYKELKDKYPEAPPDLEPRKFMGWLNLYWGDVFKLFPDYSTGEFFVKRQVLHHQKPSQDKKVMIEISTHIPSYPLLSDLLTKNHVVEVLGPNFSPSDGFAMRLLELQDDMKYVEEELRDYLEELIRMSKEEQKARRQHPNNTYEGTCCLRLVQSQSAVDIFHRCRIVGQSNGMAMVQDVDNYYQGLVELKNLYRTPAHLNCVRQTCVYGVLDGVNFQTENEKTLWDEAYQDMRRKTIRVVVDFTAEAQRKQYSGRRKFAIYTVKLWLNELGSHAPLRIIPGQWRRTHD